MRPRKIIVVIMIFIYGFANGQTENQYNIVGKNLSPELTKIINDYVRESDSRFMSFDANSLFDKSLHEYFLSPGSKIYNDIYQFDRLGELIPLSEYQDRFIDFGSDYPRSRITNFNYVTSYPMNRGRFFVFDLLKENELSGGKSGQIEKNPYTRYFAFMFPDGTTRIVKNSKTFYLLDKKNPMKKSFAPDISLSGNTKINGNSINSTTEFTNKLAIDLNLSFPVIGKQDSYLSLTAGAGYYSSRIFSKINWNGSKTFPMTDKNTQEYLLDVKLYGTIYDELNYSQLYFPVGVSYTRSFFQLAWQKNRPGIPFQFEFNLGIIPSLIVGQSHSVSGDSIQTQGIYSIKQDNDFIMNNDPEYGFGNYRLEGMGLNKVPNLKSFYMNSWAGGKVYIPITRDLRFFIGVKYNYCFGSPFNKTTSDFIAIADPTNNYQIDYTYNSNHNELIEKNVLNGFSIDAGMKFLLTDHYNNVSKKELQVPAKQNDFYYSSIIVGGEQSHILKVEKVKSAKLQYKIGVEKEWHDVVEERIETPSLESLTFRRPFDYRVFINKGSAKHTKEFKLEESDLMDEAITMTFKQKIEGKIPTKQIKPVVVKIDSDIKTSINYSLSTPSNHLMSKGSLNKNINTLKIKMPDTNYLDQYTMTFYSPFGYRLNAESFKSAFIERANELTCNLDFIDKELADNDLLLSLEKVNNIELILYIPNYSYYYLDNILPENRPAYIASVINQLKRIYEKAEKPETKTYLVVQNKTGEFEAIDLNRFLLNDYTNESDVLSVFEDFKNVITSQLDKNIINTKMRNVNVHILYFDANCYRTNNGDFNMFDNFDSSSSSFLQNFYNTLYKYDYEREHFSFNIYLKKDAKFDEKSYSKQIFEYPYSIHFF